MKYSNYFIREEKPYKKTDLFKIFSLEESEGERLISLLLSYGILVPIKQYGAEILLKFSFVGIIFFNDLIIRCFPKYIHSTYTPHKAFAQVMNVLRCYGRESKAELHPSGENEYMEFSLFSEALSLLDDYAEHGIYSNIVHQSEYNGTGEILWDKTINSIDPIICGNIPIYIEFHTRRIVNDETNYVTRLHKLLLTECYQILEESDLLSIFNIVPIRLSSESREYFGPEEYIIQRLRSELDIQFDSHKQALLHQLIRFIERRETLSAQPLHLYGTTNFETVWEAVCAKALGNQLNTPLKNLPLPSGLDANYEANSTLIKLIQKPVWNLDGSAPFQGKGTLIPDIATFYRYQDKTVFIIFDAKYYDYSHLAERLPGIGDINKQYLYELVFKSFLDDHEINHIQNIFLMPTECTNIEYKGFVEFTVLKKLGCENIKIVLIPAEKIFSYYINNNNNKIENFVTSILTKIY